MRARILSLALTLALGGGLAACGEDDESATVGGGSGAAGAETPTPTPTPEPEPEGGGVEAIASEISQDLQERPVVPAPSGEPPAELVTEDIVEGDGPRARAGSTVAVQYVGTSWSTGQEFDASWNTGQPFPFPLGAGAVIPGWDQGVVGMREGGRRLLVIPPDLGYGPAGQPPVIAPNETLVFVVDLLDAGGGGGGSGGGGR